MRHSSSECGAVLPLVALLLPVLLMAALYSLSVSYLEMAKEEMQAAADSAALAGIHASSEPLIEPDTHYWNASGTGGYITWNMALILSVETLRQNVLHGLLGETKRFPPMDWKPYLDPRPQSAAIPAVPEWRNNIVVRIERGWLTGKGFESLEGLSWQDEHPGVLKYLLFSAVKVEISRDVGMFSWFGLRSSQISVTSFAALPHDDNLLVAPFALPMCAVLNDPLNPTGADGLVAPGYLCSSDRLFTGLQRRGNVQSPQGCSPDCCPAEGCVTVPEFSWEPDNSPQQSSPHFIGTCNWGSVRSGIAVFDTIGLAPNFGVVGLPLVEHSPTDRIGFYADYDPVHNSQDVYTESDVNESTIKTLLNNQRDNLPLVRASLGWKFVPLQEGLTGAADALPGGRIDDVVWNQINKVPYGSSAQSVCREGLSQLVCDHPPLQTAMSFDDLAQPGGRAAVTIADHRMSWDVNTCGSLIWKTPGLCRSRMIPDIISDNGVCSPAITQNVGSVWKALVPVIADIRKRSATPGVPTNPCKISVDREHQTIVGFVSMNFYDVDINNGVYMKPIECTTSDRTYKNTTCPPVPFQDVGQTPPRPELPTWGFVSDLDGLGCNLVRGRAACIQSISGTSAASGELWPGHLETMP